MTNQWIKLIKICPTDKEMPRLQNSNSDPHLPVEYCLIYPQNHHLGAMVDHPWSHSHYLPQEKPKPYSNRHASGYRSIPIQISNYTVRTHHTQTTTKFQVRNPQSANLTDSVSNGLEPKSISKEDITKPEKRRFKTRAQNQTEIRFWTMNASLLEREALEISPQPFPLYEILL